MRLPRWLLILVVSVVGIAALAEIWATTPPNERTDLDQRLVEAAAAAGDGGQLRLADAAPFDWDRVYIFPAYTEPDQIKQALGFDWLPVSAIDEAVFGGLFMPQDGSRSSCSSEETTRLPATGSWTRTGRSRSG